MQKSVYHEGEPLSSNSMNRHHALRILEDDDSSIGSDDSSEPSCCHYSHSISTKDRVRLQAGDVIEYYHPIGVVGDPHWYRKVMIVGVNPQEVRSPLNLRNGDVLDPLTRVKRVGRFLDGEFLPEHNRRFMALEQCRLEQSGTMDPVSVHEIAKKAKKRRKEHQEAVSNFWNYKTQLRNEAVE